MDNINNQELVERQFLSTLILNYKIGFDLLQIKPKYLENKLNQKIFQAAINAMNKYNYVDVAVLFKEGIDDIEELADIVSEDYTPVSETRNKFMTMQKIILDNYKKKIIAMYNKKLNDDEIDCNEYLEKMERINEVVIKDETTMLDEKEIRENIDSESVGIELKEYPKLNETLKLVQGDFLIIGANTGVGKSGLLLNIMNQLLDSYQCIYFNMEMSKSTIYKRLISIRSNVPIYDIEHPKSELQKETVNKVITELSNKGIIIEHKASYLHEIKSVIAKHKDDSKHTIIFLDHIGLVKLFNKKSIYEITTEVAKTLRQFCLDYDCTIIAACQLNRASYNSEELSIAMLKDSGELENSSSKVIMLYKNKQQSQYLPQFTDDMVLEIVKNRDGRLGKISFEYDKTKQIFKEKVNYYETGEV